MSEPIKYKKAGGVISRFIDRSGISRTGEDLRAIIGSVDLDSKTVASSNQDFEGYVQEYGLSDDDLIKKHKAIYRRAALYVVAGVLVLLSSLYTIVHVGNILYPVSFIPVAVLMFVYAARLFFRAWQIRIRRLATFDEFLHTPEAWF